MAEDPDIRTVPDRRSPRRGDHLAGGALSPNPEPGGYQAGAQHPRRRGLIRARSGRTLGLIAAVIALGTIVALSFSVGTRPIPLHTVLDVLTDYDATNTDHAIVMTMRGPRTAIGLLVGMSLGLAGAMMQGVARNPLADPGILGVNAGAALGVLIGIRFFNVLNVTGYVWFAFAGAIIATVTVYLLGSIGREGATPVKLALAGSALVALLGSIITLIVLMDIQALDTYRFWVVGSLAGRGGEIPSEIWPFVVIGCVMALITGRMLNALSLGDDVARSLGMKVGRVRVFVATAIVVLAGSATAAAGPIIFVGLAIPHMARSIVGPDYRWILPYSAVLAPLLVLGSDILGRVIVAPAELQVGIITALVGAPLFIALVRRTKMGTL